MTAADTIRHALDRVAALRSEAAGDARLLQGLKAVKRLQARRFAGTYGDLLATKAFAAPTHFFLHELYSERDFSDRDQQFARIAGALQTFFPAQVVSTAVALAELHAQTEVLDLAMAQAWCALDGNDVPRYINAWRSVGSLAIRQAQLQAVLDIGAQLDRLTRTPGLRMTLRMMRGPAKVAGLASLQAFLEAGFDTFAGMGGKGAQAREFLNTIAQRETHWIEALFNAPVVACETELHQCLGKAL
ncbi:FFLEELY motif protein [Rhodoferax saidenbachensis]|uniref:DUF8198 domain-containing protein n=1 Tax=Rhodoferax saidenbachensis TaxID=1484693 RepID=A0ABU1ZR68_9BURK|nr:hypothetical protein [Rhodoferax saidenbachensis]MDR7308049.1 hypothetical protein [Rhodoferax saidenbachensis]